MIQFLLDFMLILVISGCFGWWYGRRKARQLRAARRRTDGAS